MPSTEYISKLQNSLRALSIQQGHPGTIDIGSVIDMIALRKDIIDDYVRRDMDEAMEMRSARRKA